MDIGRVAGPAGGKVAGLAAAVLTIGAMMARSRRAGRPNPPRRAGGVLAHRRGGPSRAVTALALRLPRCETAAFSALQRGLDRLRTRHGLGVGTAQSCRRH
jgi:hypothetical protein